MAGHRGGDGTVLRGRSAAGPSLRDDPSTCRITRRERNGTSGCVARAPSGSRTRTTALARQQAAATSWVRLKANRIVKEQEHGVRLELTLPHYGCGILAAERPVLLSVGPEGLEPSPSWLRARHAATNTLIPRTELGPDGIEPSPGRLKVCCAAVTPRPRKRDVDRFESHRALHHDLLSRVTKSLGVESNHRCRLIRATCFRYTTERCFSPSNRDGRNRTDFLVFPRHAGDRCPSSRTDPNGPYGNRTHLPALKERYPQADRRTSRRRAFSAPAGREALESSSPGFQPGARPSQLPTHVSSKLVPFDANEKGPASL